VSSRHGVFPPNRHVAGSTVGVEPRTPQKLSLAIGPVISLGQCPFREKFALKKKGQGSSLDGGSRWMERQ
jgi:hypothetical protein